MSEENKEHIGEDEKAATDINQDAEIQKSKRKIDIALLISILALVTSVAQLIITSPYFLDIYNQPDIEVEEGENMMTGTPHVSTNYQIFNNSNKTATNLILAIDVYDISSLHFIPENSFKLVDSLDGDYFFKKRYFFSKDKLVPNERISLSISNHIDTIAKKVKADTLKPFWEYNCQDLVPHIAELKSDLGFSKIKRKDKYIIYNYTIQKVGEYKLKGKPIK
ncbi:hypothetical protein D0809_16260 [Flavobacterium circumlabens]|uniref:Uncharacterized protein n=1 Tax=Flavobacterium circumlabens TaxID=2133765 RepID=A0A4Y7U974_9FLAO|nr:hypothetical protein [Flavobacterium circumlabens]TCN55606.1 hypothetical protein EV142_106297 [Flavobacterium circumlabens]TEB42993.1 hypothetical protein D0809_16260 [Flavobacterium circumlabens]